MKKRHGGAGRLFAGLIAACGAVGVLAAIPQKRLDIEVNWQQLQTLEPLGIQQGSSMQLAVRPKLGGEWLTLTGVTGRWEARSNITATVCYQATHSWVSNTTHTIAIDLDQDQTGTAVTNWVYAIILTVGGEDYAVGTGRLTIAASAFTGDAAVVVTNATAVPDTRTLTVSSPLTGGGTLASNLVFGFDGTANFDASGATNLSGTAIASGTVADARIAATLARDSEVVATSNALSRHTARRMWQHPTHWSARSTRRSQRRTGRTPISTCKGRSTRRWRL